MANQTMIIGTFENGHLAVGVRYDDVTLLVNAIMTVYASATGWSHQPVAVTVTSLVSGNSFSATIAAGTPVTAVPATPPITLAALPVAGADPAAGPGLATYVRMPAS